MFRNVPTTPSARGRGSQFRGRTTYRGGRGGGRGGSRRGQGYGNDPSKPRGMFADGVWHCDCTPRLPAEHFKVRKEGPNTGRWFYVCQSSEGNRCGFFLWDEDAKPREEAAVLSGRRTEPGAGVAAAAGGWTKEPDRSAVEATNTSSIGSSQMSSASTLSAVIDNGGNGSSKRTAADAQLDFDADDEDPFGWALGGDEEQELEHVMRTATSTPFETPRKAARTDAYATPITGSKRKLPWLNYEADEGRNATPSEVSASGLLTPSLTKNIDAQRPVREEDKPDTTPTPSRYRDALADTSSAASSSTTLTADVFFLLRSSKTVLSSDTTVHLRTLLDKYELKTQGIARGREITRLALKAKDAKIVELQARISAFEADRELDRARIRGLKLKDSSIG